MKLLLRPELRSVTPDDDDGLTGNFEELLTTLEHVLSLDQLGEIRTVIDYDEHELAFEVLSAMLREAGATVPQAARALFLRLAHHLQIDPALWSDVCKPSPKQ